MHVLLTGASSFIGRATTEILTNAGFRVTATFRTENKAIDELRSLRHCPVLERVDISNREDFRRLPDTVDAIVHIAGVSPSSSATLDDMLYCNVIGTRNIHRYGISAGASRFIFMSSLSVYGHINVPIVDENTPINDPNLYGVGKYFGERLLSSTSNELPAIAIRLPAVVGQGAHRSWLPNLIKQFRAGSPITIYNPDAPFNNVVHINDLSGFICSLLQRPLWAGCHAFPIAASGEVSIAQVVQILRKQIESNSKISMVEAEDASFVISSKYASSEFGYCPTDIENLVARYFSEATFCDV